MFRKNGDKKLKKSNILIFGEIMKQKIGNHQKKYIAIQFTYLFLKLIYLFLPLLILNKTKFLKSFFIIIVNYILYIFNDCLNLKRIKLNNLAEQNLPGSLCFIYTFFLGAFYNVHLKFINIIFVQKIRVANKLKFYLKELLDKLNRKKFRILNEKAKIKKNLN